MVLDRGGGRPEGGLERRLGLGRIVSLGRIVRKGCLHRDSSSAHSRLSSLPAGRGVLDL
jgi:hypothetical protein